MRVCGAPWATILKPYRERVVPTSPTQLTLRELRSRDLPHQVVEYWNPYARKRIDLWGVGDILVLDGKPGSLIIQATTQTHIGERKEKILTNPLVPLWMKAGNRLSIWAWRKIWGINKAQRRARMWGLREIDLLRNGNEWVFWEGGYQERGVEEASELYLPAGAWSAEQMNE